jgi:hypothetical protein
MSSISDGSNQQAKYSSSISHYEDSSIQANKGKVQEKAIVEEQIEHVPEGTASPGKALFMLLKAFVGTGVIFLPGS